MFVFLTVFVRYSVFGNCGQCRGAARSLNHRWLLSFLMILQDFVTASLNTSFFVLHSRFIAELHSEYFM